MNNFQREVGSHFVIVKIKDSRLGERTYEFPTGQDENDAITSWETFKELFSSFFNKPFIDDEENYVSDLDVGKNSFNVSIGTVSTKEKTKKHNKDGE